MRLTTRSRAYREWRWWAVLVRCVRQLRCLVAHRSMWKLADVWLYRHCAVERWQCRLCGQHWTRESALDKW